MEIKFFVPAPENLPNRSGRVRAAAPKAQARPRPAFRGGFYSPKTAWHGYVFAAARKAAPPQPLDGPIGVSMVFVMPRGGGHKHDYWHTVKPDKDNLEKVILDSCTRARIWTDDSRVCAGGSVKVYGGTPGAWVVVTDNPLNHIPACLAELDEMRNEVPS
ncbi:MAG: RusA family crossover junction endodeoxyribonuclease [Elusimicrobiales bacterium]|nr:RusA family crossover junction endodeoxyribonuclease [Elusimicrobiales bacterium]